MKFYTSVTQHFGNLLVCGYDNGKRFREKVSYKPYLFLPTQEESKYRTIDGKPVKRKDFASIKEARDFLKRYEEVDNFDYYGLESFPYTYIYDEFARLGGMKYDTTKIKVCVIDIEVATDEKYPDITEADNRITAITMMYRDITFVLGYGDFTTTDTKIKYVKCRDETHLLNNFIKIMASDNFRPDVVSGWNVELFDVPYLINRIKRVLSEDDAKKLSPFGVLKERTVVNFGKDHQAYEPLGLNVLDYLQLYKKFTYSQQESYKLDHICFVELGEKKLDYSEYESLAALYKNDHQKFMDYNIRDCSLVWKLDDKMKFLDLVYTFAYDSGINYVDALTTVRAWDVIIHNYLMDRCVVIPKKRKVGSSARIPAGGYVKDPIVGMHDWVVSFDLTSLYPHLIMGYNISPDTFRGKYKTLFTTKELLDGAVNNIRDYLIEKNYTFTGNSCFYTGEKQGFLPALMEDLFSKRKEYKDKMKVLKKEYEKTKNAELSFEIAKYDNLQQATKIKLNSAFGALLNEYFRWFDFNYGESITLSGQLTILWAEKHLNGFFNKLLNTDGIDYIITMDTDSVYVNMAEIVKKSGLTDKTEIVTFLDQFCETQVQPFLDEFYADLATYMNAYKQAMFMKREAIADRGIFIAKKRYIMNVHNNEGIQYEKPKLKIMGIEAVKSSTPSACREAIKEALNVILNKSEQDAIDYIKRFKTKFFTLPFEDIAFPRGINGLDKYTNRNTIYGPKTPIHVRGALLYNHYLKEWGLEKKCTPIFDKEKIKFCYLKLPNPIKEDVISVPQILPPQFGLNKYIDYDMMFEKAFLQPIKGILDSIGWEIEKKNKVSKFFKTRVS